MKVLPARWRHAGQAALTVAMVAALALAPTGPVQAQPACLVADYQAVTWLAGESDGGFIAQITITNTCADPVDGWALALTLPAGHTFTDGWSAQWDSSGDQVTATYRLWNQVIPPGASITIGFLGAWSGAYQDPVACTINGTACDGTVEENEPPTVTLTRPGDGSAGVIAGCPFMFTADASDPDGSVERVEFYVNDVLMGSDSTAPYRLGVPLGAVLSPPPALPGERVAFARAYDDGAPAASGDSAPATFRIAIGDLGPETMAACTASVEVAAGGSEPIRFALRSTTVEDVTLTVTGDPGITVSPVVVPAGSTVDATVTAAPGSAGASATINAVAPGLRAASIFVTVVPPA